MTLKISNIFFHFLNLSSKRKQVRNGGKMSEKQYQEAIAHIPAQNYFDLLPKLSHYQPIRKNTNLKGEILSLEIDCSPILSGDYSKKIQDICGNSFTVSTMTNNGYILITKNKIKSTRTIYDTGCKRVS